ncbi:GntR family transcriptional regulator [Rugosimonospora acidiphila]|uniref:GntR family transcriptional regulator n=1 Tax=Rugosimonospora acidiphila TaxID=556531 RepID=A0ABP9SEE3_9ACTN
MSRRGPGRESVYRTIANQLQDRINSGEWLPGQRMPTESALVAEFGVNRLTVRQALAQLQQIGMVNIRHGSGTFVADPSPVLEISVDPGTQVDEGSVHASIKSIVNDDVTESVLDYQPDPYPAAAGYLSVERGQIGRLDTLVGSGGDPFAVSSYWIDARRFDGLADRWVPQATLAANLRENYGTTLYYDWRGFSAAAAGALEVEHLGARPGAPLIVRDGVSVDAEGNAVYYVRRRILAERASWVRYRR